MKRKLLSVLVLMVVIVCCFSAVMPASSVSGDSVAAQPDSGKVLEARFLNMLNHNYVYNNDFDDVETIVNNAVIALLDLRDSEDESYIAENYVRRFVYSMYGVDIGDTSALNPEFPARDGFIYIVPRGITAISHEMVSVKTNEDSSYTVTTKITLDWHDGEPETFTAVSLFVKNSLSDFGYNIIYSNIYENSVNI